MNALFIHRSVGHNLLNDGHLRELLKQKYPKIHLSDYDQNNDTLTDSNGKTSKPNFIFPASDTKPSSYAAIFADQAAYEQIRDMALDYDLVIIKSCYPNSNIKNDQELEAIKQHYNSIANFFNARKGKKLLILTSPPLAPLMTNPNRAKRARQLSEWLASTELGENVAVFNFYDKLADSKLNWLNRKYRRPLPFDSHPNALASKTIVPQIVTRIGDLS